MGVDFMPCGCCLGVCDDHSCYYHKVVVGMPNGKNYYGIICFDCFEIYQNFFVETGMTHNTNGIFDHSSRPHE